MNKKILTGSLVLGFTLLIGFTGIIYTFYYFGHNDTLKLDSFFTAYRNYDRAILEYSNAVTALTHTNAALPTAQEGQADQALAELKVKASARISSLTRNDAELMVLAVEIAGLSSQELEALKVYQNALVNKSDDLGTYAEQYIDLTGARQAAYAQFLALINQ